MHDRVRAAQHLDPADVAGQQMAEIIGVADAAGIVDFHAIDQDQGLRRFGTAQRYAGDRTRAAGAIEPYPGGGGKQIDDVGRLAFLDRFGIDDRDRLPDLVARLLDARRRNDDVVAAFAVRCFGKGRRRSRQGQKGNGRKFQHGKTPHAGNEGGACRCAGAIDQCRRCKWRNACGPGTEAAPAAWSSLDGILRAAAVPWALALSDPRRQVSWLAGQGFDARLPRLPQWLTRMFGSVHRARRLQLQGQPRLQGFRTSPFTAFPF